MSNYIQTCEKLEQQNINEKLIDNKSNPYKINSIKDKLFHVIFLSDENYHENIDEIIKEVKNEIIEDVFVERDSKFFHKIMVEVFENIKKHSIINTQTNQRSSNPEFILEKGKNQYTIKIKNSCKNDDYENIKELSKKINGANYDEVFQEFKKQCLKGTISEKGGAGLGILTIAKLAKKHYKEKKFNFIETKILKENETMTQKEENSEDGSIKIIDLETIINIPFLEKIDIKDDYRIDDQNNLPQIA